MDTDEFYEAVQSGRTDFSNTDLSTVDWEALHHLPERDQDIDWQTLTFGQTPEQNQKASALRHAIADLIEADPGRHNQKNWGIAYTGCRVPDHSCGTPCCVAGWAVRLSCPGRPLEDISHEVPNLAFCAMWVDGKPMPPFEASATTDEVLEALRA